MWFWVQVDDLPQIELVHVQAILAAAAGVKDSKLYATMAEALGRVILRQWTNLLNEEDIPKRIAERFAALEICDMVVK